jgi:acyl-CoA thioester hydrolase
MDEFIRRKIGPVIMKDEVEYFKEIRLLEEVRVTLALEGLSEDGSRFLIRNEFWRADNKLAAKVTSLGGWLDLSSRKLIVPPEALREALLSQPKTDNFQVLSSSIKQGAA